MIVFSSASNISVTNLYQLRSYIFFVIIVIKNCEKKMEQAVFLFLLLEIGSIIMKSFGSPIEYILGII